MNHPVPRRRMVAMAMLGLSALVGEPAHAAYPDKTIRVVVATAPGTPIDVVTRIVTNRMAKDLGTAKVLVSILNSSPVMCAGVPNPPVAYDSLPGWAFRSAISSAALRAGTVG